MTLIQAFENFIFDKKLQGLSEDSIYSYKNIIGKFLVFVGSSLEIEQLSRDNVNDYVIAIMSQGLAKATISTYVRNTRIFLTWIYNNYDLSFDPKKIPVPKSPKKNVHILSENEITKIFDSVTGSYKWIVARNRAIVALMLDSGVRQCEVCSLQVKYIDFDRMVFKVLGKGAKERHVYLGSFAKQVMQYYMSICPYKNAEYVFLDRMGKPISKNAIRVFVNKLKHETGIDFSSHKLRHNFATNYCIDNLKTKGTSNVYDLSVLMGHESIETTKKYEHFAHEIIAVENSCSHLDSLDNMSNVISRICDI